MCKNKQRGIENLIAFVLRQWSNNWSIAVNIKESSTISSIYGQSYD